MFRSKYDISFTDMRQHPPPVTTQKLIFDEESFEHSFLKCPVCRDRYDLVEKSPRILPCHHSFCFSCITKCFQKEAQYRQELAPVSGGGMPYALSVSCPSCAAPFITTEEGLGQLTIDHRVVQLIDFIGETDRQTVDYCSTHPTQPLNFFCEVCIQPICRDCTVIDHKTCSEKQMVFDINNALQKYGPVLDKGTEEMVDEAKVLKAKREMCETSLEQLQSGHTGVCQEIKDVFAKIRKALDDREQELIDMAISNSGKGKEDLEEKIKLLKEKEQRVQENIESLRKAKAEGKIKEMFSVHQKVGEYKNEAPITISEACANEQSTCTFNARDETTLTSRISNFGDISQSTSRSDRGYGSISYTNGYLGGSSRYASSSAYSSRYIPRSYRY